MAGEKTSPTSFINLMTASLGAQPLTPNQAQPLETTLAKLPAATLISLEDEITKKPVIAGSQRFLRKDELSAATLPFFTEQKSDDADKAPDEKVFQQALDQFAVINLRPLAANRGPNVTAAPIAVPASGPAAPPAPPPRTGGLLSGFSVARLLRGLEQKAMLTFDSGSNTLTDAEKKNLDQVYNTWRAGDPKQVITIEGFTDTVKFKQGNSDQRNDQLALARAEAAKTYLVETHHMDTDKIFTVGHHHDQLLESRYGDDRHNRSVRVSIGDPQAAAALVAAGFTSARYLSPEPIKIGDARPQTKAEKEAEAKAQRDAKAAEAEAEARAKADKVAQEEAARAAKGKKVVAKVVKDPAQAERIQEARERIVAAKAVASNADVAEKVVRDGGPQIVNKAAFEAADNARAAAEARLKAADAAAIQAKDDLAQKRLDEKKATLEAEAQRAKTAATEKARIAAEAKLIEAQTEKTAVAAKAQADRARIAQDAKVELAQHEASQAQDRALAEKSLGVAQNEAAAKQADALKLKNEIAEKVAAHELAQKQKDAAELKVNAAEKAKIAALDKEAAQKTLEEAKLDRAGKLEALAQAQIARQAKEAEQAAVAQAKVAADAKLATAARQKTELEEKATAAKAKIAQDEKNQLAEHTKGSAAARGRAEAEVGKAKAEAAQKAKEAKAEKANETATDLTKVNAEKARLAAEATLTKTLQEKARAETEVQTAPPKAAAVARTQAAAAVDAQARQAHADVVARGAQEAADKLASLDALRLAKAQPAVTPSTIKVGRSWLPFRASAKPFVPVVPVVPPVPTPAAAAVPVAAPVTSSGPHPVATPTTAAGSASTATAAVHPPVATSVPDPAAPPVGTPTPTANQAPHSVAAPSVAASSEPATVASVAVDASKPASKLALVAAMGGSAFVGAGGVIAAYSDWHQSMGDINNGSMAQKLAGGSKLGLDIGMGTMGTLGVKVVAVRTALREIFPVANYAFGGIDIVQGVVDHNPVEATSGVGTIVGGALGGAFGSVFPGPGNVIGFAIGSAAGGYLGARLATSLDANPQSVGQKAAIANALSSMESFSSLEGNFALNNLSSQSAKPSAASGTQQGGQTRANPSTNIPAQADKPGAPPTQAGPPPAPTKPLGRGGAAGVLKSKETADAPAPVEPLPHLDQTQGKPHAGTPIASQKPLVFVHF